MADVLSIPPGARFVMDSMSRHGQALPDNWDEGGVCLDAAIGLADYVARLDWRLTHAEREKLLGIGGILIRSVYHQLEAGNLADGLMDPAAAGLLFSLISAQLLDRKRFRVGARHGLRIGKTGSAIDVDPLVKIQLGAQESGVLALSDLELLRDVVAIGEGVVDFLRGDRLCVARDRGRERDVRYGQASRHGRARRFCAR